MIITDYYKFEHLSTSKSKSRLDCILSTGNYPELESLRNKEGKLFIYYTDADYIKGSKRRKADKAISKTKNISSIYFDDIEQPYAYGDFKGSNDAILFVITEVDLNTVMELFICRGKKNHKTALCNLMRDSEMDHEMEYWRSKANKEGATQ